MRIGIFSSASVPASSALLIQEGKVRGIGLCAGIFNGAMNLGAIIGPIMSGLIVAGGGMKGTYHHGHKGYEDFCGQCHQFGFKRER